MTETSTGSAATVAVGTYPIVPGSAIFSMGLSSNYVIAYGNATLTTNPADLTITAQGAGKTYGQTASFPATAFTATGLVNGDAVGSVTETSTGSAATVAVGTYPTVPGSAIFSMGLSSNYVIAYGNGTLTINPAELTITAQTARQDLRPAGIVPGDRAFTTTGLVNGDTVSSVTETSTGVEPTAAVGAYLIFPSGACVFVGFQ